MQTPQFQLHARIEHRHWWFRARAQIVRTLVRELAPPTQGKRIIEVGCGTGGTLASLRHDYHCLGVDPNQGAVELAQQRFAAVEFRCGYAPDAVQDALPNADVVLLLDVLEHVREDAALLESIVDSINPGAHVLVTVPADMTLWSPHDEVYGHFRRYNIPTFKKIWQRLPVRPRLLAPMNTRLYGCIRAARALSSLRGKANGQAGTDLRVPPAPVNWALQRTFAAEREPLVQQLRRGDPGPTRRGVSLIAVLQRTSDTTATQPIPRDHPATTRRITEQPDPNDPGHGHESRDERQANNNRPRPLVPLPSAHQLATGPRRNRARLIRCNRPPPAPCSTCKKPSTPRKIPPADRCTWRATTGSSVPCVRSPTATPP